MTTTNLDRYVQPHQQWYETALQEIRSGRKHSHWMWFIFPQLSGLGKSSTSRIFAIQDLEEAKAFLHDPYLGGHLKQISGELLRLSTDRPLDIFDPPDHLKLRSCMTLFALAAPEEAVFSQVLEKYFLGKMDYRTVDQIEQQTNPSR